MNIVRMAAIVLIVVGAPRYQVQPEAAHAAAAAEAS